MTAGKKSMLLKALLFNVLQRASQIAVTVFVYLATGGSPRHIVDIFAIQSYTILGAAYGPMAYVWIVVGCIFMGAVHVFRINHPDSG